MLMQSAQTQNFSGKIFPLNAVVFGFEKFGILPQMMQTGEESELLGGILTIISFVDIFGWSGLQFKLHRSSRIHHSYRPCGNTFWGF